ncbi:MAG: hypothetical protein JWN04_2993 [Myxococcaceae bacterium]|nr:hypothetical protein [Myxococcaceae bacterium]
MRTSPGFVLQRAGLALGAVCCALSVTMLTAVASPQKAQASGPVERMVEVLLSPSDPNVVVVRWGVASQGYLFSSDGGHSYKAMCSQAINADASDKILRLTGVSVPSAAATLIDTHGRLVVSQTDGLWTDDGTGGCGWTQQLKGQWPFSVLRDPKLPDELIAVVNTYSTTDAQAHFMRRAADGVTWHELGALLPALPGQHAYGGVMIAGRTARGTQLYASINVTAPGADPSTETALIVSSSDEGVTWTRGSPLPPEQASITLLAIDPNEPKRILATIQRDDAADTLLLSEDGGATFRTYQEIRETSGVVFGPDGRVYLSDAGDSTSPDAIGGLYTAAKLGDPLTQVANTSLLDCITYDPSSQKLFACVRDKVGLLDPVSGAFVAYTELNDIPALVECPGVDMAAACLTQLNAGASWCCAGHYPFTPFCGDYNVTMRNGQLLYCGVSGRIFDAMSGRAPPDAGVPVSSLDAGTRGNASDSGSEHDATAPVLDAGSPAGSSSKSDAGGCSLAIGAGARFGGGAALGLGLTLVALGRSLRRRRG